MAHNGEKKVRLRSSDGEIFEVKKEVALKSKTIAAWLDEEKDPASDDFIPLPSVKSSVLAKVIEYCVHHAGEDEKHCDFNPDPPAWKFDPFDAQLMNVHMETICDILKVLICCFAQSFLLSFCGLYFTADT
jgi:S-phase kinase-associated protein 1